MSRIGLQDFLLWSGGVSISINDIWILNTFLNANGALQSPSSGGINKIVLLPGEYKLLIYVENAKDTANSVRIGGHIGNGNYNILLNSVTYKTDNGKTRSFIFKVENQYDHVVISLGHFRVQHVIGLEAA